MITPSRGHQVERLRRELLAEAREAAPKADMAYRPLMLAVSPRV
ncbi:MAG TPA: hypothetical protein VFQ76_02440 [Longimicrobiaceae bacterium]|nr:hypothetical protein [Longimicrobiaceae bacterium]